MKKFIFALITCLAISSIAMAAPVTDLQKGESEVGYMYWNPSIDISSYDAGSTSANGAYVKTALDDKWTVGIETIQGDKTRTISGVRAHGDVRLTDVTAQYKLDKNIRLIAGMRNYDGKVSVTGLGSDSTSENKFIYGVGFNAPIGDKTSAYATYTHDSYANEWQIGVNQDLSKNVFLNVNYRYHDEDGLTLKGMGAGVSYKF